ncbi:MAG: hypothetical protein ACRBB3_01585 [Alphaproteobacteria bacterium]
MQSVVRYFFALFFLLIISGCSTDYAVLDGDNIAVKDQVADIENEPVTRLSFVQTQGGQDDLEVVLHSNPDILSDIETASGEGEVE